MSEVERLLRWYCDWISYRVEHGACDEGELALIALLAAIDRGESVTRPDYWVASQEDVTRYLLRSTAEGWG